MHKKLMLKLTMIIFILMPILTMLNGNVNAGWSKMDSGTISDTALWGIWGSSATNVFAVGGYYDFNSWIFNSTILYYDGRVWSKMDSGTISDTGLLGIWGSSKSDVYAVGEYDATNIFTSTILHYDGSSWSKMDSGTLSDTTLRGIWGSSKTDVFAVGYSYDLTDDSYTSAILHYDGSSWSKMDSGTISDTTLRGIWGSSKTDVFAVGYSYDLTDDSYSSAILHYEASCLAEEIFGENSEEVKMLRYFRDNVLNNNPIGQEIIRLYYQWSPDIVKAMEEDEECKKEFREMIGGFLPMIR